MKRSAFDQLTEQMRHAYDEFMAFMEDFGYRSLVGKEGSRPLRPLSPQDSNRARELYERHRELEELWTTLARTNVVEDD